MIEGRGLLTRPPGEAESSRRVPKSSSSSRLCVLRPESSDSCCEEKEVGENKNGKVFGSEKSLSRIAVVAYHVPQVSVEGGRGFGDISARGRAEAEGGRLVEAGVGLLGRAGRGRRGVRRGRRDVRQFRFWKQENTERMSIQICLFSEQTL